MEELPKPEPGPGRVLVRVLCLRRLPHRPPRGRRRSRGRRPAHRPRPRDRRDDRVPWAPASGTDSRASVSASRGSGSSCERCDFCRAGRENLCEQARFTGFQLDGGFAQYTVADAGYCFSAARRYDDREAAPLLCAGPDPAIRRCWPARAGCSRTRADLGRRISAAHRDRALRQSGPGRFTLQSGVSPRVSVPHRWPARGHRTPVAMAARARADSRHGVAGR